MLKKIALIAITLGLVISLALMISRRRDIWISDQEIDFGEITPVDGTCLAKTSITIKNNSSRDLDIESIARSCGCLTISCPKKIPAKTEATLNVTINFTPSSHREERRLRAVIKAPPSSIPIHFRICATSGIMISSKAVRLPLSQSDGNNFSLVFSRIIKSSKPESLFKKGDYGNLHFTRSECYISQYASGLYMCSERVYFNYTGKGEIVDLKSVEGDTFPVEIKFAL